MSVALKWKLVAGIVLVFVAGIATGTFIGASQTRHHHPDFSHHRLLTERMRSRLQARLHLTPQQMAKCAPIFDKTARELEQMRSDSARRVHEILSQTEHDLAPLLTPEQRAALEALHQQSWHHPRRHPPPDRAGEEPAE